MVFASCGASKSATEASLYGTVWELDYISGKRIAFEALFPKKKPQITFDRTAGKVSGNAGCNGYSAPFTLSGTAISFGEPGPSTLMYCGEGEKDFLNMMQKIDRYSFDTEGKLNLQFGDVSLMRFKKVE